MTGRVRGHAAALACAFGLALSAFAPSHGEEHLFDPLSGYRIARYRAPTPEKAPGGTTISLEELQSLHRNRDAVLIDVSPADEAEPAMLRRCLESCQTPLAGSVWLANVGTGALTPRQEAYFKDNLSRLTGGDTARAVIIYCQADCWMSWNAVKRAAGYGYTALYWYPDGSDGMRDWDVPLVPATPVPMAAQR